MTGGGASFGQHGSGGAFNSNHGSYGSAFSSGGSGGSFQQDEIRAGQNHHHPWIAGYEYPPVIVSHQHERPRRPSRKSICFGCSFTVSIVALMGLLWMLLGLYGSEHLEMGLNYSRLLRANKLFVRGISVQNHELTPGPKLYGFRNTPKLDDENEWSLTHHVTIPGFYHKEWAFWLNRKSKVKLDYNIQSASNLFLVIAQGKSNYNEWIQDPGNPDWCLLWKSVHGHGQITFETAKDDEYYIGIANLHEMSVQLFLKMDIKAKVYETDEADFWCPLGPKPCMIDLPLKGSEVGVVTTPDKSQEGLDVWHVTVSYNTRWSIYVVIYGALGLIMLLIYSCRGKCKKRSENFPENAPLNSQTTATYYGGNRTVGSGCPSDAWKPYSWHAVSSAADNTAVEISDENLCTICFEEQKDSFFQPCGHCATCHSCGLRVKEASGACPICRQPIQAVRKIYIT